MVQVQTNDILLFAANSPGKKRAVLNGGTGGNNLPEKD
jgi:hypothetical protein